VPFYLLHSALPLTSGRVRSVAVTCKKRVLLVASSGVSANNILFYCEADSINYYCYFFTEFTEPAMPEPKLECKHVAKVCGTVTG